MFLSRNVLKVFWITFLTLIMVAFNNCSPFHKVYQQDGALDTEACEAAFNDRSGWVASLTAYLRSNRDLLAEIAGDRMAHVEATYLGWIDVRDLGLQDVEAHFLKHGLGLSMGTDFGGEGFVRFNFACPRSLLEQGMQRLEKALSG